MRVCFIAEMCLKCAESVIGPGHSKMGPIESGSSKASIFTNGLRKQIKPLFIPTKLNIM